MKYSIQGRISATEEKNIVNIINNYTVWRFVTNKFANKDNRHTISFEVWVNELEDKNNLFNSLKPFVNKGEVINWHKCTHDEPNPEPCVIIEEYRGE